jgi:carboxylesterase type B
MILILFITQSYNYLKLRLKGTEAIGNLALLDQNLALKWVYSNADRLGGDKQRIVSYNQIYNKHN